MSYDFKQASLLSCDVCITSFEALKVFNSCVLVAQGNRVMALLLVLLHYFAGRYVDSLILNEIPGTVPYLTGLGIVGGISSFDNPLKGAIMGPMLLALLSVAYKLHLIFLSSGTPLSFECLQYHLCAYHVS